MMLYDVFIGYSQLNSAAAEAIQACLIDAGLSLFPRRHPYSGLRRMG